MSDTTVRKKLFSIAQQKAMYLWPFAKKKIFWVITKYLYIKRKHESKLKEEKLKFSNKILLDSGTRYILFSYWTLVLQRCYVWILCNVDAM